MALSDPRAAVATVLPSVYRDLVDLVAIPSVSADPAAVDAVRASAAAVAALLSAAGLEDVEVLEADGGLPAVVGHRPAPPGAPTVLLYAHHDVQPAGDVGEWASDPFTATLRDGRLYGRGAADDKAGIALHLAALRALDDDLQVGVTVFVEGEEEIGSPNLGQLLDRHRERLSADIIVLADSTNWRIGVPALTTSLRGGASVIVEVRTLQHAVHSGVYGGPVPDALTALARLLATLHDDDGTVAVAGLKHGTADPLDLTDEQLRGDAGVLDGVQLLGTGPLTARLWAAPALAVVGVDAPRVDTSALVLVPSARARLVLRISPGDDAVRAQDALVTHLRNHAPWGAQVDVTAGRVVEPYATRSDGPAHALARSAMAEAWGVPAVDIGVGGSIAFIDIFARAYPDAEILVTGIEDPDTRAHGANESLHVGEFERACVAEVLFLQRLGGDS